MKFFVLIVGFLVVAGELCQSAVSDNLKAEWMSYKLKHGKSYANQAEDASRMANFLAAKEHVERHNAEAGSSYKMALNHLSDWTQEELAMLNGYKPDEQTNKVRADSSEQDAAYIAQILASSSDPVPDELDWRNVPGRVGPVGNQAKYCGSCWTFSTAGALEGQEVVNGVEATQFESLSEQELLDCSRSNLGCSGGAPERAFDDIANIGGIEANKDYPYQGYSDVCRFDKKKAVLSDKGHAFLRFNATEIKETLAKFGPISVAMQATENLLFYSSGILDDNKCSWFSNHAVLLVGYGTDSKDGDYWIVKNSWSDRWGEKGFFRIKRGVNMCRIEETAVIPTF